MTRRARRARERRIRAARRYGLLSGAAGVAVAATATATGLGQGGISGLVPTGDSRSVTGTEYDAHLRGASPADVAGPTEVPGEAPGGSSASGRHATDAPTSDDGTSVEPGTAGAGTTPSTSLPGAWETPTPGSTPSPSDPSTAADQTTPGDGERTVPPSTSASGDPTGTPGDGETEDPAGTTSPGGPPSPRSWSIGDEDEDEDDGADEADDEDETEDAEVRETVLALVNTERALAGCAPLRLDDTLAGVADEHAEDMRARGYFAHDGIDGRSAFERMVDGGYGYALAAENIARGQPTAQAVVDAWMGSDEHRDNILNCDFEDIGIGFATGDDGPWWVQNFGVRAAEPS